MCLVISGAMSLSMHLDRMVINAIGRKSVGSNPPLVSSNSTILAAFKMSGITAVQIKVLNISHISVAMQSSSVLITSADIWSGPLSLDFTYIFHLLCAWSNPAWAWYPLPLLGCLFKVSHIQSFSCLIFSTNNLGLNKPVTSH